MLYRFGFKTFFRSPIQVILSFLLIFASLCAISFLVSYEAFNPIEFEKECFYITDTPYPVRAASEKYMNFAYYGDMPFGGYVSFPKTVAQSVKKELDKIGQGYSVNIKSEILQGSYNATEGCITVKETSLGAVHLDYYIAGEVGSNTLYDEAGNIAPYFSSISMDLNNFSTDAYRTFYKDFCYYCGMDEESLAAYGYTLHGRFPQSVNEVAIPWSIYNAFAAYGYRSGFSKEELTERFLSIESITEKGIEKISSVDDIIGKKIALGDGEGGIIFAEIVGVLEIDYAKENWEIGFMQASYIDGSYVIDPSDIEKGFLEQIGITAYEPIFSIIVSEEYFDSCVPREEYCSFITVLKHSEESVRDAYFELGNRWRKGLTLTQAYVQINYVDYFRGSFYMFGYGEWRIYPFITYSYFLIPLTVLLTAYLGFALSRRSRKQYALLRSLGASKKKATLSYLLPVACMLLICAIPAGGIGYHFADKYIRSCHSYRFEKFGIDMARVLSSRSLIALIVFLFAVVALSLVACAVGISLQARKITNVDKKRKKEKTN